MFLSVFPPAGTVVVWFVDVLSVCNCTVCLVGFQKHKENFKTVRVEEIDGLKLVKNLAVKMEEVFQKKAEATRVGREPMMSLHGTLGSINRSKKYLFNFYKWSEKKHTKIKRSNSFFFYFESS